MADDGSHPMTLADQVATDLMAKIASGAIAPGDRLPGERQIAESLNVSRVSVRSALQQLKARGMLQSVQGGGTRVVSSAAGMIDPLMLLVRSSTDNLHDLAEIRVALESWATRRATEQATPEFLLQLDASIAEMTGHGTDAARQEIMATADVNFHLSIARAANSPIYLHILSTIRDVLINMLTYHRLELFSTEQANQTVLDQHRRIVHEIKNRDPDAAEAAMRAHLTWVLNHYEQL